MPPLSGSWLCEWSCPSVCGRGGRLSAPWLVQLGRVPALGHQVGRATQLHAALRAAVRLVADDLGVHRADVARRGRGRQQLHAALRAPAGLSLTTSGCIGQAYTTAPFGDAHVHLGHERKRLVRVPRRGRARAARAPPSTPGCGAGRRTARQARARRLVARRRCARARMSARCLVLERQLSRLSEEHVDDDALRRSQDHRVDELLVLVAAAVATDQLHLRARQRHLEHASVGRVGQVEADDLAALARSERSVSPPTSSTLPNRPIAT